jgi:hypothetical protein
MKTCLLIDISTWKGHHETYFKQILLILNKENYFVYACCENNPALRRWVEYENIKNCAILDFQMSQSDKFIFKSTLIIDKIVSFFNSSPTYKFSSIAHLVLTRQLQQTSGRDTPVFFVDADSAIPAVPLWLAKLLLPDRWMALYICPSYESATSGWGRLRSRQQFLAEKLFSLSSCRSILCLHPVYIKFFERRFDRKKFFFLPEIIEPSLGIKSELVANIESLARGRKIISTLGYLLPKKNILLFLQSATQLDPDEYFILIVGYLPEANYAREELESIHARSLSLADNSYINLDYYVAKEQEFNQLIDVSDVIYIQYRNHPFSSNILAKSIQQRKPVIIGDGYIMQKMLLAYNWSAIVPQEADRVAEACVDLAHNFKIDEEKYDLFSNDYAEDRFKSTISQSLKLLEVEN